MTWSPAQYLAFEDERTRPVRDLLAALPALDIRTAVDIGCGPGNSTEALAARFPHVRVIGIDSSSDMIGAARKRLPALEFEIADVAVWAADAGKALEPIGVILGNAVLQWVPDHAALLPALAARLAPRGCLALQLPDNLAEPAQTLMREVAAHGPWRERLADAEGARVEIESAEWYYGVLRAHCARVEVWRTTYYHPLAGAGAIVEWFKGTGLRPFLDPLGPAQKADFLARYTAQIERAYSAAADGTVLLPFPRLFMIAVR
jgi:trans-aconitate 2-methyltransferase